jgi:hypothetical protein
VWTTDADWTGSVAPLAASQHLKVFFNLAQAGDCTLDTTATVGHLVMGDNNPASDIHLTLAAGADLTAGLDAFGRTNWTAVGYNRSANMSVAAGAVLRCRNHLWIGLNAPAVGKLDLRGGTVEVAGQFGLGWESGTGFVTLRRGGTLKLDRIDASQSIHGDSAIDIQSGTITIGGNRIAAVNGYVAIGKITSFGGAGTVTATYDAGSNLTTVSSSVPSQAFYSWIEEWEQNIGYLGDDPDGDKHGNLYEYALNGDPTDSQDQGGAAPRIERGAGTLIFRHLVRKDDEDLVYAVQSSTDLSPDSWVNAGLGTPSIMPFNEDYDELVHPLPAGVDALFLRLKIHYP